MQDLKQIGDIAKHIPKTTLNVFAHAPGANKAACAAIGVQTGLFKSHGAFTKVLNMIHDGKFEGKIIKEVGGLEQWRDENIDSQGKLTDQGMEVKDEVEELAGVLNEHREINKDNLHEVFPSMMKEFMKKKGVAGEDLKGKECWRERSQPGQAR